jgi:hypothetical protein
VQGEVHLSLRAVTTQCTRLIALFVLTTAISLAASYRFVTVDVPGAVQTFSTGINSSGDNRRLSGSAFLRDDCNSHHG